MIKPSQKPQLQLTEAQLAQQSSRLEPEPVDADYDTPDVGEVLQAEDDYTDPVVKVCVVEPVRVDEMPSKLGGMYSVALTQQTPPQAQRVVNEDPRRKSVTLLPLEGDVWVSTDKAGPENSTAGVGSPAFRLGANVPFTIGTSSELWAIPVAGGPTVTLSVLIEQWAR